MEANTDIQEEAHCMHTMQVDTDTDNSSLGAAGLWRISFLEASTAV